MRALLAEDTWEQIDCQLTVICGRIQSKEGTYRMSGHSKWNNIKGKKEAADSKKSKVFSQLSKQIRIAVKEGGSGDPGANPTLRTLLEKARAANMPKDKIARAIDRGMGKTAAGVSLHESVYEGFGPFGEAYLVQVITDNPNRTSGDIRFIFSRSGGSLAGPNAAMYLFSRSADGGFVPTLPLDLTADQKAQVAEFIEQLLASEDVEDVYVSVLLDVA